MGGYPRSAEENGTFLQIRNILLQAHDVPRLPTKTHKIMYYDFPFRRQIEGPDASNRPIMPHTGRCVIISTFSCGIQKAQHAYVSYIMHILWSFQTFVCINATV